MIMAITLLMLQGDSNAKLIDMIETRQALNESLKDNHAYYYTVSYDTLRDAGVDTIRFSHNLDVRFIVTNTCTGFFSKYREEKQAIENHKKTKSTLQMPFASNNMILNNTTRELAVQDEYFGNICIVNDVTTYPFERTPFDFGLFGAQGKSNLHNTLAQVKRGELKLERFLVNKNIVTFTTIRHNGQNRDERSWTLDSNMNYSPIRVMFKFVNPERTSELDCIFSNYKQLDNGLWIPWSVSVHNKQLNGLYGVTRTTFSKIEPCSTDVCRSLKIDSIQGKSIFVSRVPYSSYYPDSSVTISTDTISKYSAICNDVAVAEISKNSSSISKRIALLAFVIFSVILFLVLVYRSRFVRRKV